MLVHKLSLNNFHRVTITQTMQCKQNGIKLSEWSEGSRSVVSDSCDPMDCRHLPCSSIHGIFPGKSTGVGCHFLLQRIFPTQGMNPGLLHCRQMLYCLSHHLSGKLRKILPIETIHVSTVYSRQESSHPNIQQPRTSQTDLHVVMKEGLLQL